MSAEIRPSENQKTLNEQLFEFFDQYSLSESKAMLWSWYKATTTGNFADLEKVERENLATFYERVSNLLNAAHDLKNREAK